MKRSLAHIFSNQPFWNNADARGKFSRDDFFWDSANSHFSVEDDDAWWEEDKPLLTNDDRKALEYHAPQPIDEPRESLPGLSSRNISYTTLMFYAFLMTMGFFSLLMEIPAGKYVFETTEDGAEGTLSNISGKQLDPNILQGIFGFSVVATLLELLPSMLSYNPAREARKVLGLEISNDNQQLIYKTPDSFPANLPFSCQRTLRTTVYYTFAGVAAFSLFLYSLSDSLEEWLPLVEEFGWINNNAVMRYGSLLLILTEGAVFSVLLSWRDLLKGVKEFSHLNNPKESVIASVYHQSKYVATMPASQIIPSMLYEAALFGYLIPLQACRAIPMLLPYKLGIQVMACSLDALFILLTRTKKDFKNYDLLYVDYGWATFRRAMQHMRFMDFIRAGWLGVFRGFVGGYFVEQGLSALLKESSLSPNAQFACSATGSLLTASLLFMHVFSIEMQLIHGKRDNALKRKKEKSRVSTLFVNLLCLGLVVAPSVMRVDAITDFLSNYVSSYDANLLALLIAAERAGIEVSYMSSKYQATLDSISSAVTNSCFWKPVRACLGSSPKQEKKQDIENNYNAFVF